MRRPLLPALAAALLLAACAAPVPVGAPAPDLAAPAPVPAAGPDMRSMDMTPVAYGAALLLL